MTSSFLARGLGLFVGIVLTTACSASSDDAASGQADFKAARADATPAFPYSLPQVQNRGGPTLARPTFVSITFDGDPMRGDVETFTSHLAGSSYWKTIGADYGVGAAAAGTPIHVADAPASEVEDSSIGDWLVKQLDGALDPSAIYAIYYPAGTTISLGDQKSCTDFGAFHDSVDAPDGTTIIYAVMPRCDVYKTAADVTIMGEDFVTFSASHELLEAATDPQPAKPAFTGVDPAHQLWGDVFNSEVGDLCARGQQWAVPPNDVGYKVQRMWSNAAAKAGHDPCIPEVSKVYFNAVPVLTDAMPPDFATPAEGGGGGSSDDADPAGNNNDEPNGQTEASTDTAPKVVTIAIGEKKTIDVHLSSDRATSGEWTVHAMDWDNRKGTGEENLAFAFDQTKGNNGDTLHLTITAKTPGPHPFVLVSTLGNQSTYWPGLAVVTGGTAPANQ
jgi:hypothetical protein